MASKNFSGILRDPLGTLANNDKYRFTHVSTTGEVIRGSTSYLNIGDNGTYNIDIEYGNVSIESYSELGKRWIAQGTTTINADTVATTLPALLNALVPASDALILQLEALLADAESAADRAESVVDGIGTAATRDVGKAAGNVMEVGAFGLGGISSILADYNITTPAGFYSYAGSATPSPGAGTRTTINAIDSVGNGFQLAGRAANNEFSIRSVTSVVKEGWVNLRHTGNTTVDSNGFIKAASPIIRVYSDGMREVLQSQGAEYEKVGVGHYLIKNTLGFAKEGWYIETPKDANGSVLFITEFSQLENNDIEIRTYTPTGQGWKPEKGAPVDISEGRWIDIRLHEEEEGVEK